MYTMLCKMISRLNINYHQRSIHYTSTLKLFYLSTIVCFPYSNDNKNHKRKQPIGVSIYKIRPLVIMETNLYTSF